MTLLGAFQIPLLFFVLEFFLWFCFQLFLKNAFCAAGPENAGNVANADVRSKKEDSEQRRRRHRDDTTKGGRGKGRKEGEKVVCLAMQRERKEGKEKRGRGGGGGGGGRGRGLEVSERREIEGWPDGAGRVGGAGERKTGSGRTGARHEWWMAGHGGRGACRSQGPSG